MMPWGLRLPSGIPRNALPFLLVSLINATGSAFMWPLITIYVHNVLHQNYAAAGFVLLLQSSAGVIGQMVGGSLYHRVGPRWLISGSLMIQAVAQLGLIVARTWWPYVLMMTANGFLFAITMPAVNAFIGFRWKEERRRLFTIVYVFNNMGVAIGTSLAGLLASVSFSLTFLFNGLSTFLFAVFFLIYVRRVGERSESDAVTGETIAQAPATTRTLLGQYRVYILMTIGALFIWFATSCWNSGIAPYLNQRGQGVLGYSWLWTINGVLIVVMQPLISWFNRAWGQSLVRRLVVGTLLYMVAFGWMWRAHGLYLDLVIGMVIGTLGEMLVNPTVPALVTETTGRSAPFYLGLVGGVSNAGRLIGPPLFGFLFDSFGVSPILLIAALAAVISAISFQCHGMLNARVAAKAGQVTEG
ncbi:MAG: MFS transporter [Firmicutes bacterium]|nr:MFS transporter [Bacillota bacterium]